MQGMKKLLLAACLFWAGTSQVARAEQNVNYIYKEKGQLVVHLGTIPDRFQSISVPIWSEQNGQDDLIWYPVQRGENGFDLQVPLTNHLDQAGLYHIHVYGIHSNGNIEGLFPLQTIVEKKDLASSQPKITVRPSTAQLFEIQLQLFEDVEEVLFPIWSEQDGQDDLIWYPAKRTAPGRYQLSFNAEKHKGKEPFISMSTRKTRDT